MKRKPKHQNLLAQKKISRVKINKFRTWDWFSISKSALHIQQKLLNYPFCSDDQPQIHGLSPLKISNKKIKKECNFTQLDYKLQNSTEEQTSTSIVHFQIKSMSHWERPQFVCPIARKRSKTVVAIPFGFRSSSRCSGSTFHRRLQTETFRREGFQDIRWLEFTHEYVH